MPHSGEFCIGGIQLVEHFLALGHAGGNHVAHHSKPGLTHGGLDAAHAAGDSSLAANLEETDLSGRGGVSTAAQLHGNTVEAVCLAAHLHQSHHIAVLITEELADFRVLLDFGHGVFIGEDGEVFFHPLVDQLFHAAEVSLGNGTAVDIETQAVGIYQ